MVFFTALDKWEFCFTISYQKKVFTWGSGTFSVVAISLNSEIRCKLASIACHLQRNKYRHFYVPFCLSFFSSISWEQCLPHWAAKKLGGNSLHDNDYVHTNIWYFLLFSWLIFIVLFSWPFIVLFRSSKEICKKSFNR